MENEKNSSENITQTSIDPSTTNSLGIASFVFGVISIFSLSIITVPLAIIFGLLGLRHHEKVWAILGLTCAAIGFLTSPILLGLFAVL